MSHPDGPAAPCASCGAPDPGGGVFCRFCRELRSAEGTADSPPSVDTFAIDDAVGEGGFDSGGDD